MKIVSPIRVAVSPLVTRSIHDQWEGYINSRPMGGIHTLMTPPFTNIRPIPIPAPRVIVHLDRHVRDRLPPRQIMPAPIPPADYAGVGDGALVRRVGQPDDGREYENGGDNEEREVREARGAAGDGGEHGATGARGFVYWCVSPCCLCCR